MCIVIHTPFFLPPLAEITRWLCNLYSMGFQRSFLHNTARVTHNTHFHTGDISLHSLCRMKRGASLSRGCGVAPNSENALTDT